MALVRAYDTSEFDSADITMSRIEGDQVVVYLKGSNLRVEMTEVDPEHATERLATLRTLVSAAHEPISDVPVMTVLSIPEDPNVAIGHRVEPSREDHEPLVWTPCAVCGRSRLPNMLNIDGICNPCVEWLEDRTDLDEHAA